MHNFRPAAPGDDDEEMKGEQELDQVEKKRIREMTKIRQNELALAHLTKKLH